MNIAVQDFPAGRRVSTLPEALSGHDSDELSHSLILNIVDQHISGLPESPAKKLYQDLDNILQSENSEVELRARTSALSSKEKALYARFLLIRNTCKSAANVIVADNAVSSAEDNPFSIHNMIRSMKDKGVTAKQIGSILGTVNQWKTGTSHPTQHLSEEGKLLFRDMLSVTGLPTEERTAVIETAIKKMFDAKITRSARMTVKEETQSDRAQAKLHRKGQRKTFRQIKSALNENYGAEAPDLLSSSVRITLPYHTWNGGGDADGKSNADKKALFEGLVGYTLDAIEEHLEDVDQAIESQPDLEEHLKNSRHSLGTVLGRLKEIEEELSKDEDTIDFDQLKTKYADLYKGLNVDYSQNGDLSVNSETELYEKLTRNLHNVIKHNAVAAEGVLEESLFVMRQYKDTFTTAKIEKRANGLVDIEIMNKLFGDREFQNEFLTGAMKRQLTNQSFTSLSSAEQINIMRYVGKIAKNRAEEVQFHFFRIFPKGKDDKNYPNQLRERGERLALQAITPNKFGMSIVAEAQEMSAEYQFFLGEELFGVRNMMHTMLNEDMETLEKSPDFLIDFTQNGGLTSVQRAAAHNPRLKHYLEKHGVMLPCSDSVKQLGPAATYLQAQAINVLMKFAVQEEKTICIKWGNGQVLTRGGGNAHIPGRLKAQALQWHLNGEALDPNKPEHLKILANVMFASNTEQGRAADFISPNDTRISNNQLKMISEMLGRSMELMGLVREGTYIAQVSEFSKGTRRLLGSIAKDVMMRGYENMRNALDANGNRTSDMVADQVSNMKVAGDANQGARADSKATEGAEPEKKKGKPVYDLRAIGTTIAISHMRTYHDGWYSFGMGLQEFHKAYIDREVGSGDLKALLTDALWSNMIKNGLRAASMSDLTHGFEKLDAADWTHNHAMTVGKSVDIIPSTESSVPPKFTYDDMGGTVSPEQAYMAKLYYDQALFVTYTDMLAEMKLEDAPTFPTTLEEVEQKAVLHLDHTTDKIGRFQIGEATNQFFPFVDQDKNRNRAEVLPSQILCDVAEERHDDLSTEERYMITAAQRATQVWNNSDLYLDQDAYGSPFPEWKAIDKTCAYQLDGPVIKGRAPLVH